ncbi:MAG TPA: UDP-N-acetylglucosamine 1-carboxyvinyltransferase, partial [Microthrixaceae bacterium]|nr:UDP-N-acetylglucosamine 1-carboxyvinyltransferase [Microthrixaceae bacterium]
MGVLRVRPGPPLSGEVRISGAKNSALKLMAATVLAPGRYVLSNVPRISDVEWMGEVLTALGTTIEWTDEHTLVVHSGEDLVPEAPYELVERMRASTALLGPLLARCGEARVAMPGGDDFGSRPINLHLAGLEALGAKLELSHGTIVGTAGRLTGARIVLEYPSVGATENLMLAATRAFGTTVIDNAAREPEIADLAAFVNRMGAKVIGAGSPTITVEGVDELSAVAHEVIPDRVEAATFLAAVGVAGGEIALLGARDDHMAQLVRKLGEMGLRTSPDGSGLWAMGSGRLRAANVATLPYPGIATDYLPMLVAMLSVADGTSFATENLFGGRFRYVGELARMGADIDVDGHHLVVRGVEWLSGAPVRAFDIRAGAALVVAGMRAEGETVVHD